MMIIPKNFWYFSQFIWMILYTIFLVKKVGHIRRGTDDYEKNRYKNVLRLLSYEMLIKASKYLEKKRKNHQVRRKYSWI